MTREGTCTLGRIGVTAANGGDGLLVLQEPHDITLSNNSMTISGTHVSSTADIEELMWVRDQVVALAGREAEPVIPCTFSNFEHLDGYYRPVAASADRMPGGVAWSVDLERIRDWRNPKVEIHTFARILTNSHSITLASVYVGNPGGTESYYPGISVVGDMDEYTHVNADDNGSQQIRAAFATGGYTDPWTQTLYVPASKWYKYGCRIGYDVQSDPFTSAGSYLSVVGHRAFPTSDIISRIQMSNGLVRVLPVAGQGINTYWYDGSNWDGPYTWVPGDVTAGAFTFTSATVLRNTPEECSIRLVSNTTGLDYGPTHLDLTVRRGNRTVLGYLSAAGLQSAFKYYVEPSATYSATAITGGLRRTSNDGSGNRPFLVSNNATTNTTGTGRIAQSVFETPLLFGVGVEIGGSGSSGIDAVSLQYQPFFMGQAETQVVTAL